MALRAEAADAIGAVRPEVAQRALGRAIVRPPQVHLVLALQGDGAIHAPCKLSFQKQKICLSEQTYSYLAT